MRLFYSEQKKDFRNLPIVQDPRGVYFWNGSNYYEPNYKEWDNNIIPAGYNRYTDGSHSQNWTFSYGGKIHKQYAWDLYLEAWTPIYCDLPMKIEFIYGNHTVADGYVLASCGEFLVMFGHCYTDKPIGTIIENDYIVKTNPSMYHVHLCGLKNNEAFDIASEVLKEELPLPSFDINSIVRLVSETNLRLNAGVNTEVLGTGLVNAQGKILSKPIEIDGFNWQSIRFGDAEGFMYTGNMVLASDNLITNLDGSSTCSSLLQKTQTELSSALETVKRLKELNTLTSEELRGCRALQRAEADEAMKIKEYNRELLKKIDEGVNLSIELNREIERLKQTRADNENTIEQLRKTNEDLRVKSVEGLTLADLIKLVITRLLRRK